MQNHLICVLIPLKIYKAYSYRCAFAVEIGSIVRLCFGRKIYNAIVVSIDDKSSYKGKFKQVEYVYDIKFKHNFIDFMQFFADYSLTPLGLVATIMLRYFNEDAKYEAKIPPGFELSLIENRALGDVLSAEQALVAKQIIELCEENKYKTILLEGVTGCGKTEVYFEAISYILAKQGQALILLPEISLTKQFLERFFKIFGFKAYSWHSGLAKKKKQEIWSAVYSGEAKIVIGVRSALFLPFNNLKLIVVDEEHDSSYKQEENIFYNARDMAVARARFENIAIILSSATPSVETLVNAQQGKYKHFKLPNRFNNIKMPKISLVDLNQHKNQGFVSDILLQELAKNLAKKQQSILFLGRRGYAPLTLCKDCGHRITCPNCSVYMVQHKLYSGLLCHYCGYSATLPIKCENCSEQNFITIGCGVERIFEEITAKLPQARLLMLSTDLVGNIKNLRRQLQLIEDGAVDIIIGTQLISKGHNFSNVSLVGVIDADLSLHNGDPRASEKTYQILTQVTGRAGRTGLESIGIIQSYNCEHQAIKAIINATQNEFYAYEIAEREKANMPPFSRFAALIISAPSDEEAKSYARLLRHNMHSYSNIAIFGPAQAPIAVLCNKYRYRILIRATKSVNIQQYIKDLLKKHNKASARISIQVDIDPQSFF